MMIHKLWCISEQAKTGGRLAEAAASQWQPASQPRAATYSSCRCVVHVASYDSGGVKMSIFGNIYLPYTALWLVGLVVFTLVRTTPAD